MLQPSRCTASSEHPHDEILEDAMNVATEATSLTNQRIRQRRLRHREAVADPDSHAAMPIDRAELVTFGIAGAATNIAGIEPILAVHLALGRRGASNPQSTVVDDQDYLDIPARPTHNAKRLCTLRRTARGYEHGLSRGTEPSALNAHHHDHSPSTHERSSTSIRRRGARCGRTDCCESTPCHEWHPHQQPNRQPR
jgi:hypothetical protein